MAFTAVTANPPNDPALNAFTEGADESLGDRRDLSKAARGGLCGSCTYARLVRSKNSTFVRCTQPELPKYQGQPVLRCPFFSPV